MWLGGVGVVDTVESVVTVSGLCCGFWWRLMGSQLHLGHHHRKKT